jgi:hypothetical protein
MSESISQCNAIRNIGNTEYNNSATVTIKTSSGTVVVGPSNKCNVLVVSFTLAGGPRFYSKRTIRRGYPLVNGKLPAANWLGDAKDTQHLTNLRIVTDGGRKPGDIVA